MVRMGACRVPDRGSIPRRGDLFFFSFLIFRVYILLVNLNVMASSRYVEIWNNLSNNINIFELVI